MDEFLYMEEKPLLTVGETILWHGKPKRSAFITTKSLTLLPIAIVWICVDSTFIAEIFQGGAPFFLIPFMLLHLLPVWIWLGNEVTASRRWKNTTYFVTNRRIIIRGGFFAVNETSLFYKDIRNAQVRIGLLDKLFQTGDIIFDNGVYSTGKNRETRPTLEDLENPHEVYGRIQKIIMDIQTDIEYPNAYRPAENPGYSTDYRP